MRRIGPARKRQKGAVLIMAALAALVLFGFMGVALNLSHAYDLKSELQNMADAAALSGAKALNGKLDGINTAVANAKATAASNKYNFSSSLALTDANIKFADNPDAAPANWLSVAAAQAAPTGLLFIKIDTGTQTSVISSVANFMRVAGDATPLTTSASAVAGRFQLGIAPLAVCAIETTKYGQLPHAGLPSELTEFGFRRGLGYNILDINPLGGSPNKFLLDPVDIPPGPGNTSACNPSNSSASKVAPYLCGGTASIITTLPGYIYVNTGMSASVAKELNSRFNLYGGGSACKPATAPPDANIRQYSPPASATWMSTTPQQTIQGQYDIPGASVPNAASYGVLWSYSTAVQYAAIPPAGGYTLYTTANWPSLYPTTTAPTPTVQGSKYPAAGGQPYQQTSNPAGMTWYSGPATNGPGVRDRRVLNVAIVDCSTLIGSGSCATIEVLGIGRFFMTVQASPPSAIDTEFAGLVPDADLTADIRLYH
ncbi:MAG: Tad domain-containing protein [Rhodocyclaceae bacterium]|nr:Tad domain-containing protein [Rhodocyclaceae bacterium]